MKIATVTPYDLSLPGGVNRYALDIARWVRSQGHDVQVIGPASSRNGAIPTDVTILGSPRSVRAGGTIVPIALDPGLGKAIGALLAREQFDIVHLHEPLMPVLPLQFLRSATRDGSVPIVGTFHAAEATGQRLYRLAGPALRRWTRRLAARTAISETARRVAGPALGGPCTIIPGCTDSARFSAALPPLAERAGASPNATPNPDCRTILFVGRGEPRKGLGELIEAFARLRLAHDDLRLVVVGPPGPLGPALRERVRRAGWSNVHFVGPVSEADLPRYYQAAHVFVSPATGGEAFGLVLTEAMAAGAPVIAGDNPGYRAVLRGGADGVLVPPRDPAALAAAIDALLRDEPRRRRMIAAGRARARDFSVESVGAQFLALYDSLAAQARRERGRRRSAGREGPSGPKEIALPRRESSPPFNPTAVS